MKQSPPVSRAEKILPFKRCILFLALLIIIICENGCVLMPTREGLEIARNGHSRYRIVIADDASPSTMHGAVELQRFLYQMTGAELPIVSDNLPVRDHEILLGGSSHLNEIDIDIDFEKLGDEGYVICTVGSHLIIAGGEPRGTMYGVYGLLEDHLGCRWFTPDVSRIPRHNPLILPPMDETQVPVIEYREPYVWEAFDGDWAARNRMNRNSKDGGLGIRHGGKIEWVPEMFVHTFEKLVPPDEYFSKHPEYFSLVGGRRIGRRSQLCCTTDDVIRIVTEGVLTAFRENPQAYVLSVSQNDWDNHCECRRCRALAGKEGSDIAPVLYLVNRVAEEVEKEFPDRVIETLAYQWTRKAPKTMRPRHNVVVRLCTIECCFSHPLNSCDSDENIEFARDLMEWSRVTDRLWIWNYVTSFSHYFVPYPNLRVRDDNIRFFVKNNVTGIFQQDVYTTPCGELSGLSGYLNAKLLWNPEYDEDTAIDEYLDGVYGSAAPPIREYIDMLHDKVEEDNIHIGIWQGPAAEYLTDEILARSDSLWNAAENEVRTMPGVLDRVRTARLSVDYAVIAHGMNRGSAWLTDHENLELEVNPEFTGRVERFCRTADRAGVLRLKEYGYTVEEFRDDIEKKVRPRSLTYLSPVKRKTGTSGLIYRFYEGNWNKRPDFAALTPSEKGAVERFELPFESEAETFAFAFKGFISVPRDGIYTFSTYSDGYAALTIGSSNVVNNSGTDPVRAHCGFAALKAGTYPVEAHFFTRENGSRFRIYYSGPGIDTREIPGDVLTR